MIVSAGVFSGLLYLVTQPLHIDIPLIYCFLFGALISPTDPIAVAAILKKSNIPPRLNTIISGESLFNDGFGLVLFIIFLNFADPTSTNLTTSEIVRLLYTGSAWRHSDRSDNRVYWLSANEINYRFSNHLINIYCPGIWAFLLLRTNFMHLYL